MLCGMRHVQADGTKAYSLVAGSLQLVHTKLQYQKSMRRRQISPLYNQIEHDVPVLQLRNGLV